VSDSLIPISDEQAKAIQEVAKATGTTVEAATKAGTYIAWVLGTVPRDLVGILGDWLAQVRIRNLAREFDKTREVLRSRGVTETIPVSPALAVPLLRAAADEDRDELVDLWARLLANAMDPHMNSVRYSFIDAVKAMDPPDARTMNYLYREKVARIRFGGGGDASDTSIEYTANQLGTTQDDLEVSVRHLEVLGFLSTGPNDKNVWFPNAALREFMRACYPELGA